MEEQMNKSQFTPTAARTYLPAAGRDIFLPFYDTITGLLGADSARAALLDYASLRAGDNVLDIGCGTGTLAVLLRQRHPGVVVTGLDPDPKALARAKRKAEHAGLAVRFEQGFSDDIKHAAACFDLVVSSFMFHHLEPQEKAGSLREIRRVLKPGGRLLLLDFDVPEHGAHHGFHRMFHSHARLSDNSEDRILGLMTAAGFQKAARVGARSLIFGLARAGYYRAVTPE
jgi:ubiquinone/menaquinone biosynthesis C-methylase UbiE